MRGSGMPNGTPSTRRSVAITSRFVDGFGDVTFTTPSSSCSSRKRMARNTSSRCTQLNRCRPPPARPVAGAAELRAAHPDAGKPHQRRERRAVAQGDRGAQRDLADAVARGVEERPLPRLRDLDREPVAELAVLLGLRTVVGVTVDRRGARVEPHRRRRRGGATARPSSAVVSSRERKISALFRSVYRQFDALAGQVHQQVGAVDEAGDRVGVAPDRVGVARGRR